MTTLPLPSQTLAWLNHAANAGQRDAQALLHLIDRADKRDQDVAKFVDSYSSTIAAICYRLQALERGAKDPPAAPVHDSPVADALLADESALKAEPEGEGPRPRGDWFTVAMIAQDLRSRGLAEQVAGEDLLQLANSNRSQPGRPATPPATEPGEVAVPVAVGECPHCGYEGVMVPLLPAGEVAGLVGWFKDHAKDCQELGLDDWAVQSIRAAAMLQQQEAELATLRGVPVAWCLSDEFENAMKRGGSFNGWKDPGAGANKCDMRLYAVPLPAPQAGEVEA